MKIVAKARNRRLARDERNWYEFLNENTLPSDCQLVSAVNAHYYLTGKKIRPLFPQTEAMEQYNELAKLAGCEAGPAVSIEKVYDKLGLVVVQAERHMSFCDLPDERPVEATIYHQRYGAHSVLIIDKEPKTEAVQVLNFKYGTTTMGWIFMEEFSIFAHHHALAMWKVFDLRRTR